METPNKTTFVRLSDLDAELREMESVITNDRKNEIRTSDQLLMDYEAKKAEIDAKMQELRKQFNSLIENGLLNEKDAQPFVNDISTGGLDYNACVSGYVRLHSLTYPSLCPSNDDRFLQSSNKIRMSTEAENQKISDQLRKQAEEIEALRAQLSEEKKKKNASVTRKTFDPVAIVVEMAIQSPPKLTDVMLKGGPAFMETLNAIMQLQAELRQLAPERFSYYGTVLNLYRANEVRSKSVKDLQKENERFVRYMQNEKAIVESKNQAMKKMIDVIARLGEKGPIDISGIDDENPVDSATPEDVFDPVASMRNHMSEPGGTSCFYPTHVEHLQKLILSQTDLTSIAPEAEMYYDHTLMLYQYSLRVARTTEEIVSLSKEYSLYLDDQKIIQRRKKESFDDAMRVINKLEKALNKL